MGTYAELDERHASVTPIGHVVKVREADRAQFQKLVDLLADQRALPTRVPTEGLYYKP
jgi:hypothetical protein